uniref:Uncharacterized protein n=1 Tax=Arundo donax TaxID=35708 RepID=A0A0A8YEK3_ARUDO
MQLCFHLLVCCISSHVGITHQSCF